MCDEIKLAIIDPHEIVRSGLSFLLEDYDEFSVVGQGHDFDDARYLCMTCEPDILMIDFMCDIPTCEAQLYYLRTEFPQIQIFILTNVCDRAFISNVLQMGVLGYWLKRASVGNLIDAIQNIIKGQLSLDADVLHLVLHNLVSPQKNTYNLTDREQEVLSWLVKGLSNREIGNELYISHSTVKNHVSKILSKLDVNNRVEAVTCALKHGLVEVANVDART